MDSIALVFDSSGDRPTKKSELLTQVFAHALLRAAALREGAQGCPQFGLGIVEASQLFRQLTHLLGTRASITF